MKEEAKKKDWIIGVCACILLLGPWIASPILFCTKHILAGILVIVIPYLCLVLWGYLRKRKQKQTFFKIKDANNRVDIIPISDTETILALNKNSALTFAGEPSDGFLNLLYNWLNNEGVLKEERLKLYTYSGQELKNAFGKKKLSSEQKFMSVYLKDLNINESNERQFSLDHFQIGGRWLDDIVGNS